MFKTGPSNKLKVRGRSSRLTVLRLQTGRSLDTKIDSLEFRLKIIGPCQDSLKVKVDDL